MSKIVVRKSQINVERVVRPAPLVDNIYEIFASEINKMSVKSRGAGLEPADIKSLTMIAKSICDIRKDERDQLKADSLTGALDSLSKEELLEMVQKELEESK